MVIHAEYEPDWRRQKEIYDSLKVGMKVEVTRERDFKIVGIVGEILDRKIYIFHNNGGHHGGVGNISPASKGFEWSWCIGRSIGYAIKILDQNLGVDTRWTEVYN